MNNINSKQKIIGQLNGMANYSVGNYKAATKRLEYNTALGDSTYTTCYFLGMCYFADKLYPVALKWFERAYLQNNNNISLLCYYGTSLVYTYDPKKGIDILKDGVEKIGKLDDMLPDFFLSLAYGYLRSERYNKAIEYFKSAYKRQSYQYTILYEIARAYDFMHDYENALVYYKRFVKTAPQNIKPNIALKDEEKSKSISHTEFLYHKAYQRIQELKEKHFFKNDKK